MASRVQPINLTDFTGGLNLRTDAFGLGENESPDMLNVDIDPRGGFVSRSGWTRWNTVPLWTAGLGTAKSVYSHGLSNGQARVWVALSGGTIINAQAGVTASVGFQIAASAVAATASPHGADFAAWGDDLYVACGTANQSVKVDSVLTGTRLTAAGAASWSPYASPVSGVMPKCEVVAAHQGYLFVANTVEDAGTYPSRVRWSHPNAPTSWLAADYIDILDGGGPVTALVPMEDHLLIFKQTSVWALYGYDSNSWQLVNVATTLGAPTRQSVVKGDGVVFFYSVRQGVFAIAGGKSPQETSVALRPMFTSSSFVSTLTSAIYLGWFKGRLYFSCPYHTSATAADARSTFVLDTTIGQGAWMLWRGADGNGVGPFAQGSSFDGLEVGASRGATNRDLMRVEASTLPVDNFGGTNAGFETYYVTRWVDAGYPTLKKSWRRPDLVVKDLTQTYSIVVQSFRDFDEATTVRVKNIPVQSVAGTGVWGSFTWGDGTLYGVGAKGAVIEKGGSFGSARALQLKVSGDPSKQWGVDAIVLKFIPRRLR